MAQDRSEPFADCRPERTIVILSEAKNQRSEESRVQAIETLHSVQGDSRGGFCQGDSGGDFSKILFENTIASPHSVGVCCASPTAHCAGGVRREVVGEVPGSGCGRSEK